MLSFNVSVGGETVGLHLADDPTELAYALKSIAERADMGELVEALQEITVLDTDVELLKRLAEAIASVKQWGEGDE